jgi:hypothetical protein
MFFIVDGDLAIYLIPSRVIAGRVQFLLRTYGNFIVGNAAGLWSRGGVCHDTGAAFCCSRQDAVGPGDAVVPPGDASAYA